MPDGSRTFRRFAGASAVSFLGDGFRYAALPLLAVALGAGPADLGLLLGAATLPFLVVGLAGGVLVDRVSRRSVLLAADAARVAVTAGLAVLVAAGSAAVWHLYAVAFVMGALESVTMSATFAYVPELVPAASLPRANATLAATQIVGRDLAGPVLGAAAVVMWAPGPFLADAATFAVSFALIATLPAGRRRADAASRRRAPGVVDDLRAGWRWMRATPPLVALAAVAGAMNLANMGVLALQAFYVDEALSEPPAAYGVVMAAVALGGVGGSWSASRVIARAGLRRVLVAALTLAGAGYAVAAAAPGLRVACAGLVVTGTGITWWGVATVTLRQQVTPGHLMGRADSLHRCIAWGVLPLGSVLGGVTASLFGPRAPYGFATVVAAVLAVLLPRVVPPQPAKAVEPTALVAGATTPAS